MIRNWLILFGLIALSSCEDDLNRVGQSRSAATTSEWLIPLNSVFDGGPGRDGIPSLTSPDRIMASQAGYILEPELVIGYYDGETAIAYPHHILDWHEIVNETVDGFPMAITYCPLTGTGVGWDRTIDGSETEFGVSGLLYNNNLIPFDRSTTSNWTQIGLQSVNGSRIGTRIETFQVVETRWSTWREMFPDTEVVSLETGFDRPYGTYPYGDYRTNHDNIGFPLTRDDRRLNRKERVHGLIINEQAKVYQFSSFIDGNVIEDSFQSEDVIVVGNRARNFMVSFYAALEDGKRPSFTYINDGRAIMEDDFGNKWDIFGYAISGPDQGDRLTPTEHFMGFWFSWGAFYPDIEIYEEE
ncbi:MAG: DUF3179 domain-containing protein [Bacteroidota bacterium]